MRPMPRRLALTLASSVFALPAAADITAEEVWADWQRLMASLNAEMEVGDESNSGGTVTLRDVSMTFAFPEGEGSAAALVEELVFEERGDGTVEIKSSAEFPIAVSATDPDTDLPITFNMIFRQPGLVTIASRDGATTRYGYVGPELGLSVDGLTVDGESIAMNVDVAASGLKGDYVLTEGTPREFESSTAMDGLTFNAKATDPDDPGTTFDFEASLSEVSSQSEGTVTGLAAYGNMSAMLSEGFRNEWTLAHGGAEYTLAGTDSSDRFNVRSSSETGTFEGALTPEGLVYGGSSTGLDMAISGSQIPFPQVTFSMAETEGRLAMPVAPGDEPTDFGVLVRMAGLEISEAIWGMVDPGGQLPRDPATLVVDIAGKGRWLLDIFDPDAMEEFAPGVPGEIDSVTIGAINLSLAGAELTGDGAFEFDNSGEGPFAPAPSPSGRLDLSLVGGNALLDTLVNMGLVPQDQAMGARMMLGLFARPGDGPDSLVSSIEIGKDGSVSANGQRIR
ncbi:MAG: DUF2125 domain-containing protein [Pseudomonadota bacterium]